jgi:peptidoglycan hydrolase-like protein with peptidoglycan-binding domain
LLASLVVLYALFVLLSESRGISSSPGLSNPSARIADAGDRLMQTIMARRQPQSKPYPASGYTDRIMKVQQALKDDGFYSGPVDGTMRQSTREAIRAFQQSNHLNVTGNLDDDTARELGLR